MSTLTPAEPRSSVPAPHARTNGSQRRGKSRMDPTRNNTAAGIAAWLLALLFAVPVLWMILTSFHSEVDAATNPPSIAADLNLDAYKEFFGATSGVSPWPSLINSATASIFSTVLVLLLAIPAAYALSIRPVKKWTDVLFFFLSTKMMPVVAAVLPLYLFAKTAGALDNIWFLGLMYTSMNLPIAVWMMRSFLDEVPVEMLEAAQIDGAGLLLTLRKVVAPVAMPGIAATALICFIFSWNELLLARVLTGVVAGTAPVFLTGLVSSQGLFIARSARPPWLCPCRCCSPASPPKTNSSKASPWVQ